MVYGLDGEDHDQPVYTRAKSRRFSYPSATLPGLGIPLGTLTAQIASKSFWTREMLDEALERISQASLKESSDTSGSDYQKDGDFCNSKDNVGPQEGDREWRSPRSSVHEYASNGYYTPPYLSPGITRKLTLTEDLQLPFLRTQ